MSDHVSSVSRDIMKKGSKSFSAAARLFDPATRESAELLYAWCRYCDDRIDGQSLGFADEPLDEVQARARLEDLFQRTKAAYGDEEPDDPVFAAFQRVVKRHDMPMRLPLDLLVGFSMDVEGRKYESVDDLLLYCYHVAGVVGVMMAIIMGSDERETLMQACDLGIAFQLTNISRDVIEDAEQGRVYLPRQWLREVELRPGDVMMPECRTGVHFVVERLLGVADKYYDSAGYGLSQLDFRSAWAIAAARNVYSDIGRLIRKSGPSAWNRRPVVSGSRKAYGVFSAAFEAAYAVTLGAGKLAPPRADLWTKQDLFYYPPPDRS